jgi:Flp pilus assembly secretin CpaC
MRQAWYSLFFVGATAVATGAIADAPAKHATLPQPMLRTSSNGTVAAPVQKPVVQHAAKVVVSAPKTAVAKTAVHVAVKTTAPSKAGVEAMPVKVAVHVTAPVRKVALVVKPRKHVVAHHYATAISVPLDEVRVVAFSQPIATVYVGNPAIADVSMIDGRHAFVLGKGFGATNVVALDADGKQIVNQSVTVFGHTGNTVILHRGTAQATLNCAHARCEIAPMPGDDKDTFANRMEQLSAHQDAGVKAATAGR